MEEFADGAPFLESYNEMMSLIRRKNILLVIIAIKVSLNIMEYYQSRATLDDQSTWMRIQ
jgi:hypothetical protein